MVIPYGMVGAQWWDAHFLSLDYGFGKSSASAHLHVRTQDGRIKTVGELLKQPNLSTKGSAGRSVAKVAEYRAISAVPVRISARWGRSGWKLYHNVANRRDGCKIGTAFEVKKEIPD
jgi:hypothetical protein